MSLVTFLRDISQQLQESLSPGMKAEKESSLDRSKVSRMRWVVSQHGAVTRQKKKNNNRKKKKKTEQLEGNFPGALD